MVAVILILVGSAIAKQGDKIEEQKTVAPKQVSVIEVGDQTLDNVVSSVGAVKPETKVDITALTRGTVQGLSFSEGDVVSAYTMLANLNDNTTLANLSNAMTSFSNAQNSYNTTVQLVSETVNQAELGVRTAEATLATAQISYDSALLTFSNSTSIQITNNQSTKEQAVISSKGYLNSAYSALDQVNYILKEEGNSQLPGISGLLGIRNVQTINQTHARVNYQNAKRLYNQIVDAQVDESNIEEYMSQIVSLLSQTENTINSLIFVLDNTGSSFTFPESTLNAQKSTFVGLRTSIISSYNLARTTLNSLNNLDLYNSQEESSLQSGVDISKKQLESATIGLENAKIALENAKNGKEQQLNAAQSGLDGASGQLNVAQAQANYLNIKTPIAGTVTQKLVDVGDQVNPGQKIAQVANINVVKVELDLNSELASRLKVGQSAFIEGNLPGVVNKVFPSADPVTKKVRVEVLFDNANNDLLIETYVDVDIIVEPTQASDDQITFFVPLKSVTIGQSESYVFIVDENNNAQKIVVTIGSIVENKIEIKQGLRPGDKLITEGNKRLQGGETLEIK